MVKSKKSKVNPFHDPTLVSLLVTNGLVIVQAFIFDWNVITVLWIYWFQSVIIGYFSVVRILNVRKTHPKGQISNLPSIFINIFCYGFFYYGYVEILNSFSFIFNPNHYIDMWIPILINSFIFFLNHYYSYKYHLSEYKKDLNIKKIFENLTKRIVPMHLTLMVIPFSFIYYPIVDAIQKNQPIIGHSVELSSVNRSRLISFLPLLFFLLLRTYLDAKSHIKSHSDIKKGHNKNKYVKIENK